ncbi:HlyD family efflux transporter periplasmic adaptor subunit [bacterium]|nr:HlyD family efflux transporter periplasmic adaptor subunit [bacterium]
MRTKKNYIIAASLGVVLILIWLIFKPDKNTNSDILIKPQLGEFAVTVTATGELQAKNSVKIYGPIKARMVGIWQMNLTKLVPEGTVVKKGDFVAELDRSELSNRIKDRQIELQKAESRYTIAKLDTLLTLSKSRDALISLNYGVEEAKLKKEQSVYEAPAIRRQIEISFEKAVRSYEQAKRNYQTEIKQSKAKMEEIEAEVSQHRRKLTIFNETLGEFTVKAPADGMVIYYKEWNGQKKTEGSIVQGWDPVVATLPDLSVMESITYVNEVDIKKIKIGQPVQIGLDADAEKELSGEVTTIANIGEQRPNSTSKVFEVKISISSPDTTLRPSMTTSNEIIVAVIDSSLYIPLECIYNQDTLTYVFKRNGSGIIKQQVELGLINENSAIIKNGIKASDDLYLSVPNGSDDSELVELN